MSQFSQAVRAGLVVCIVACAFAWLAGMLPESKSSPTLAFIAATLCWISIQLEFIRTKK